MYDLISHLIYLDNFSEKKTNKTSPGKKKFPFSQMCRFFSVPSWLFSGLQRGRPPLPAPGARLWGQASKHSSSGAHGPPRGVRLINFSMVESSLMFFFAMSRL